MVRIGTAIFGALITLKNKELKERHEYVDFPASTVIELYTMVLLLRIWMQWAIVIFTTPSHSL